MTNHFDAISIPEKPGHKSSYGQLIGSAFSLALAKIIEKHEGLTVVITNDSLSAIKLEQELKFFCATKDIHVPILIFPDWEILPYDSFSPHQDIVSLRLKALYQLNHLQQGVLIVPVSTLMHRLCPKEYVIQNSLWIKIGQRFELTLMRKYLEEAGYFCVAEVAAHGEFSVRGSMVDLFPMGSETPYRIELFDNEIDSIRTFEIETQRSLEKITEVQLLPAREYPLNTDGIATFRTQFRARFEGNPTQCPIYLDVSEGNLYPGLEYYLPLFFPKTQTLFEYLPKNCLIVQEKNIENAALTFWKEVKERHDQYGHDRLRPILSPSEIVLEPHEMMASLKAFPIIELSAEKMEDRISTVNFETRTLPPLQIEIKQVESFSRLKAFIYSFKGRILLSAESTGRREIVREWLRNIGSRSDAIDNWAHFLASDIPLGLMISPLEQGVILDNHIAIITETELLGKRVMQRRLRKTRKPVFDLEVQSLAELTMNDPVVHLEHGIGRYQGLVYLTLLGQEGEFFSLSYAEGAKLYVPVTSLNLISRYLGADKDEIAVHRLGSDQWQKIKSKALEEVRDTAAELLEIYAKRSAKKGFSFPPPDEHYKAFSTEFPFEETPDQQKAIDEVIEDLTSDKPMDRVVCGDVGFGKTEVAMRACFVVVQAGKQVAILVPTTLLAEQHYQTFLDRFSEFAIKVEVISRFKTQKEQQVVIEKIAAGTIDILIGTHKILQDNVIFKDLGLLIIDEEHRFGVRQKENYKALRSEVDILTLTATPIPRTLNLAMGGLRDLSIIATPPLRRLSIKTFVRERNAPLIVEAISRELHRGGQVYFLHNTVETIEKEARDLSALLPSARVVVAHGQMRERELEKVMSDFYHRRYNVLVCTTIIETGIDIPTVNTIIIDRADKLGLAQLHQLRGRVGRSHHQAYAFCLIPPKAKLSSDAKKRLEALEAMEELGAGFSLATHDLEIRGAGELLGESQSGDIQQVGFHLYMELLAEAVKTLKKGEKFSASQTNKKTLEVDLQIPALIPVIYIADVQMRLVLYKRIASCPSQEKLEDLKSEMIDRFGVLPGQTINLFKITELKIFAKDLGIHKIEAGAKGGRIEFSAHPKINPNQVIHLIQKKPTEYRLDGPNRLKFILDLQDVQKRVQVVRELLNILTLV
jgi:transcription-repair coupling factor (superfamily II helicase)